MERKCRRKKWKKKKKGSPMFLGTGPHGPSKKDPVKGEDGPHKV